MVEWLSDNKEWIAPATSIGTLLVGLFYAQLLYSGYSRQTRPRLLRTSWRYKRRIRRWLQSHG